MKTYNLRLFLHIFWIILFAFLSGMLIVLQWYWLAFAGLIVTVFFIFRLYAFQQRTVKDMRRFINAIEFSEFNISFKNFAKKGLAPELIPEIESAIRNFNKKLGKIEAQQNFYETLLGRIDFAIIVIDKSGTVEWINKAALDIFGKPQPRKLHDLANVSPTLPESLDSLTPRDTKIIRIKRDKQELQMAATALYFTLERKSLKLISLKNIQSVLEESESDAWKKLIRVLTHEIMNSLSPIISLAETFSEPDPENQELIFRAMQTIHRRSKGLIGFVNNYQKLTKIPHPVISKFPASELMTDIKRLLNPEKLTFQYTIQPDDMLIEADRSQLEQVIINLIKNAWESSGTNKPTTVDVKAFQNEYAHPVIQVSDNGQGILPEILDKIFVPFFTTKPSGSGIGLSICRQIINLHGGSISVESEPEQGSVFCITL